MKDDRTSFDTAHRAVRGHTMYVATRRNSFIKTFYQRLLAKGKLEKVALTAAM